METAETLKEKFELLSGLSDEEKTKLKEKFIATLEYVSVDQIKEVMDILEKIVGKNPITKAKEVKVLTIPVADIEKSVSFMREAGEPNIYSENIIWLGYPVVDLYKRINYCRQYNIQYKNEDGTYKDFLFKESLFQKEVNGLAPTTETISEPSIDTAFDDNSMEETEPFDVTIPEVEIPKDEIKIQDEEHEDVSDYMQAEADLDDIESQTTTFDDIKKDLEAQLAELDALRSQNDYENDGVYRFNDIEQETYSVGRGR